MTFPSINPGQVAALTASYLQNPSLVPTDPQAMYTLNGQYLSHYLGGNGNLLWSNSGLTYDSTRNKILSVCNGGHADCADNSVYEFDVDGTQTWSRVFDATYGFGGVSTPGDLIPSLANGLPSVYTDTSGHYGAAGLQYPASRHSYGSSVYMPSNRQIWMAGGIQWDQAGGTSGDIWWYDPSAHTFALQGESIGDGNGMSAAWDPHRQWIYFHNHASLNIYDPSKSAGSRFSAASADEGQWTSAAMNACFDMRRRRYVMAGWNSAFGGGNLYYYDLLSTPTFSTRKTQPLAAPFIGFSVAAEAPGILYDQVRDVYIIWLGYSGDDGNGHLLNTGAASNAVWSVDPDTFAVTKIQFTGDTVPISQGATWTRFIYNVQNDVYLLFNDWRQNCYAFCHPDLTNRFAMPNQDL